MANHLLADLVVVLHFSFILFVVFGGLLVFRWPKIAFAHVPAFAWGALISFAGWVCPLTYWENDLRGLDPAAAPTFIERTLVPLIYPELLFAGGFPREGFIAIGVFVLVLNAAIYWRVWRSLRR